MRLQPDRRRSGWNHPQEAEGPFARELAETHADEFSFPRKVGSPLLAEPVRPGPRRVPAERRKAFQRSDLHLLRTRGGDATVDARKVHLGTPTRQQDPELCAGSYRPENHENLKP